MNEPSTKLPNSLVKAVADAIYNAAPYGWRSDGRKATDYFAMAEAAIRVAQAAEQPKDVATIRNVYPKTREACNRLIGFLRGVADAIEVQGSVTNEQTLREEADWAEKFIGEPTMQALGEHRKYTPANQGKVWEPCRCPWGADHGADHESIL